MQRFEEALDAWTEKRLTQEEAAALLGVCARTFRHYVKRRVRVHEHADGTLSVFHGPRRLARYDADGAPAEPIPLAAG